MKKIEERFIDIMREILLNISVIMYNFTLCLLKLLLKYDTLKHEMNELKRIS